MSGCRVTTASRQHEPQDRALSIRADRTRHSPTHEAISWIVPSHRTMTHDAPTLDRQPHWPYNQTVALRSVAFASIALAMSVGPTLVVGPFL